MPYINGTLGCCDDTSVCFDTVFCFCCQVGRQWSAIDGFEDQHNCGMCVASLFCAPFMPCCLRCKVSDKYQLEEGCVHSVCCGVLCGPCSVCMTGRELNARGTNPGGFCCKSKPGGSMS